MTDDGSDTDDCAFLGGKLLLRQMRSGHRVGTDACLLAAALSLQPGECVADVGAGVGAAALALLSRSAGTRAILIDRDPRSCELARHNVGINGFEQRVRVIETDVFDRTALATCGLVGAAEVVISNPPFYERATAQASPNGRRAAAHVLDGVTHADWLAAIARLAVPRGRMAVINTPAAVPALLRAWPTGWGGPHLRWVHPLATRAATRVLITTTSGSRAPLSVGPPLVLHSPDGGFTPEAEHIHRGSTEVP